MLQTVFFNGFIMLTCVCVCQICQVISEVSSTNQELLRKYKREMNLRKKCHNELVRLKGPSLGNSQLTFWFGQYLIVLIRGGGTYKLYCNRPLGGTGVWGGQANFESQRFTALCR